MVSYASYSPTNDLAMMLMSSEMPLLSPLSLVPPLSQTHTRRRRVVSRAMLLPPTTNHDAIDDGLRCRYPSKLCFNPRVRKASGALHRYCTYHRDKANANQKRWVNRQRGAILSPTASSGLTSPPSSAPSSPTASTHEATPLIEFQVAGVSAATLSEEDWDGLLSLLATPSVSKGLPPPTPRYRRIRTATTLGRTRCSPLS